MMQEQPGIFFLSGAHTLFGPVTKKLHIFCSRCGDRFPISGLYAYPDHFEATLISTCPHQIWKETSVTGHQNRFETPLTMEDRVLHPAHPFRTFAHIIYSGIGDLLDSEEKEMLERRAYSFGRRFIFRHIKYHTRNLEILLRNSNGEFILRCKQPITSENCLTYKDQEVVQLTMIFPAALEIAEKAQYFQVDASFFALRPYVDTIPLGIINNESFPWGLQISPTEKARHYKTFFDELQSRTSENHFENKPFLSDQGTGLIKFVQSIGGLHFFCYRHLMESLGSNSRASIILRRLLFCSCLEEYQIELPQELTD
jgi:hypothetical protein